MKCKLSQDSLKLILKRNKLNEGNVNECYKLIDDCAWPVLQPEQHCTDNLIYQSYNENVYLLKKIYNPYVVYGVSTKHKAKE